MDGLQITVTNFSDMEWSRNNWHIGAGQTEGKNWTDEISQTPSEKLRAHDGQTVAAVNSVQLAFFVKDALWMVLGYGSDAGCFAVRLQQYFHMFGIGPQDGWSYWIESEKRWSETTTDTTEKTWVLGKYEVVATPELTNSSGSISVTIRAHK